MSKRAIEPNPDRKGGYTRAGVAFSKHAAGQRQDGTFPKLKGDMEAKNQMGEELLYDLLTDPNSSYQNLGRGGIRVDSPQGSGARWNSDGSFDGFID
ncbi:hypothetical protein ACE5IS_19700 [Leptospira wolffii]|uniref:General secretion pathway protein GspG n=1 Tax=Leptospira wolffii TaxID=409998 RepID=A0ABV5BU80_9LEPT